MARITLVFILTFSLTAMSCSSPRESGDFLTATSFREFYPDEPGTEGQVGTILRAEMDARNDILASAGKFTFDDGRTLEDAVVEDPFIRARVYDLIRTAPIVDKTVKKQDDMVIVTVTVRLDMASLNRIVTE